ncbi:MAG: hypothetical protein NVS1B11_21190 [Terriglobales bacterium]
MRKTVLRSAALIILAGMLGGQITELFDHWDHTAQTGRDVDYTVVIVAACLGVVFAVGEKVVCAVLRLLLTLRPQAILRPMVSAFRTISVEPFATGPPTSSLSPLRI